MIGMSVRVEDGIKMANVLANGLLAKIGRRINEYRVSAVLDQHGRARSPVAAIGRMTNRTTAANRRHTHRCAAAQHRERCFHFPAGTCCGPLASALVTSTYAMRSSYSAFCRKPSSFEVRLPLVFS